MPTVIQCLTSHSNTFAGRTWPCVRREVLRRNRGRDPPPVAGSLLVPGSGGGVGLVEGPPMSEVSLTTAPSVFEIGLSMNYSPNPTEVSWTLAPPPKDTGDLPQIDEEDKCECG